MTRLLLLCAFLAPLLACNGCATMAVRQSPRGPQIVTIGRITYPTDSLTPRQQRLARDIRILEDTILAIRVQPQWWYEDVFREVEKCSGLPRPSRSDEFWVAQALSIDIYRALHDSRHDIYFAVGQETDRKTVAHELLHHLLDGRLPPGPPEETESQYRSRVHPDRYFRDLCGSVVQ